MQVFEWDETKRTLNLDKHGVDFVDAVEVFHDPNRIELETVHVMVKSVIKRLPVLII